MLKLKPLVTESSLIEMAQISPGTEPQLPRFSIFANLCCMVRNFIDDDVEFLPVSPKKGHVPVACDVDL